jgi:hypothetical protein
MKGVQPWFVRYRRFLAILCSSSRLTPATILLHLFPSPIKLGRQSCRVTCLLISVAGSHFHEKYKYDVPYLYTSLWYFLHGSLYNFLSVILLFGVTNEAEG